MASTMTIDSIANMNMALGSTMKAVRSQTTLISKSLKGQISIKAQAGILKREARTRPLQSMGQVNWGFRGSVAFILPQLCPRADEQAGALLSRWKSSAFDQTISRGPVLVST